MWNVESNCWITILQVSDQVIVVEKIKKQSPESGIRLQPSIAIIFTKSPAQEILRAQISCLYDLWCEHVVGFLPSCQASTLTFRWWAVFRVAGVYPHLSIAVPFRHPSRRETSSANISTSPPPDFIILREESKERTTVPSPQHIHISASREAHTVEDIELPVEDEPVPPLPSQRSRHG